MGIDSRGGQGRGGHRLPSTGRRGSRRFSDLDLVIVSAEARYLLEEDSWLNALGVPILSFRERRSVGEALERRVLFEPGLDVDFIPVAVEEWTAWMAGQIPAEVLQVFARGHRVILDREGDAGVSLSDLCRGSTTVELPDETNFRELCADYLYHGLWTAKKLRRGELFIAKTCLDCQMTRALLSMVEWHARLSGAKQGQIWARGRFLEQWAPPWIREGLRASSATYTQPDLKRALGVSMGFFGSVGADVARLSGHAYPSDAHARVERLIEEGWRDA